MKKELSEMTLQELWQLFPIRLTQHNPQWRSWYEQERGRLQSCLPLGSRIRIHHIGSTAVDGIWAKPIVDILVEVENSSDFQTILAAIQEAGYGLMRCDQTRASFHKGYTPEGFEEKVFHLHLRCREDHDELYFRDYLIEHPHAAQEYQRLKLGLWPVYEHDRDGYTNGKTDFVTCYTEKAKALYGHRYR